MDGRVFVGGGGEGYAVQQYLSLKYPNRHGLVAGATGTGKTITLQILAEGFSAAGVPVFLSDVKGDLSGMVHLGSSGLYATFLLWLLSELFEELPEVGGPEKPKPVFFFDEAHLLFDEVSKALVDKIEQVVRLICSKGVEIYFCSEKPCQHS